MTWLPQERIPRQLAVITAMASGVALFIAGCVFPVSDIAQLRSARERQITTAARMIETPAASALAQGKRDIADSILGMLRGVEQIQSAAIYPTGGGPPFAAYFRQTTDILSPAPRPPGIYVEERSTLLSHPIVLDGGPIGTLIIRAETPVAYSVLGRDLALVAAFALFCFLISFLLTSRLRRAIAQPLVSLARTAREGLRKGTGEQPGYHADDDEITILTKAFEAMRSRRAEQDRIIGDCHGELERVSAVHATAIGQLRLELAEERAQLERNSGTERAFLAGMSHRIRTSLHSLNGMLQLTLPAGPTVEQKSYADAADEAVSTLLKASEDLIDFGRIQSCEWPLEHTEFRIAAILYEVMGLYSPAARRKGLELFLDIHADIPPTALGDPAAFRRVVANLIDNAIRFTETGAVTVAVAPIFNSGKALGIHVRVKDTGRGLTAVQFESALKPFEARPADISPDLATVPGLGLAICNHLIGLMGGCLWAESESAGGATLHFTATFEIPDGAPAQLDLNDLRGARVLVADASLVTRRTIQQLLSRWHMLVTPAASGSEAMELLKKADEAGHPFDLALVDRHMFGIEGSSLWTEIHEHEKRGKPVLVALSSVNSVSVTEMTRNISPFGYLVKPVSHATLLKTLSGPVQAAVDQTRTAGPAKTGARHILVAEDNPVNQAVAVDILLKDGYKVSVATNGEEVMELLGREGIDLILMDVQMPGMGGLEATRQIRQKEKKTGGHVTIIALTAHALAGDREICLTAGVDYYVSKPLVLSVLRATVNRWLSII